MLSRNSRSPLRVTRILGIFLFFSFYSCADLGIDFQPVVLEGETFSISINQAPSAGSCVQLQLSISADKVKELTRMPDSLSLTWSLPTGQADAFESVTCAGSPVTTLTSLNDNKSLLKSVGIRLTKVGMLTLQISTTVDGKIAKTSFNFIVEPGAPYSIQKAALVPQVGRAGAMLSADQRFSVVVRDQYSNVVPGVLVEGTIVKGNTNLSFSTRTTQEDGIAVFPGTLGSLSGFDTQKIRFSSNQLIGSPNVVDFDVSLSPSTPTKVLVKGNATGSAGTCSVVYQIELQDTYSNVSPPTTATLPISLSDGAGSGNFYSDSSCTNIITSVDFVEGQSSGTFYYSNMVSETVNLQASAATMTSFAQNVILGLLTPLSHAIQIVGVDQYSENITSNSTLPVTLGGFTLDDFTGAPIAAPSLTSAVVAASAPVASVASSAPNTSNLISIPAPIAPTNVTNPITHFNFTVFSDFPAAVPSDKRSCEFLGAFASVDCFVNSLISIPIALFQGAKVKSRAWSDNGGPAAYLDSNEVMPRTHQLKKFSNGSFSYDPWNYGYKGLVVGDDMYFMGSDNNYGAPKAFVYRKGVGIFQVSNTNDSWSQDIDGDFVEAGGRVYFSSYDNSWNQSLYSTNGSDLRKHFAYYTYSYTSFAGRLFFVGQNESGYSKLYSTNGSDIKQHTNILPASSDDPNFFKVVGTRLFFRALVHTSGYYKVFSTDGSDLKQHSDIVSGQSDDPQLFTGVGNRLYFRARSNASGHSKLYSTDGSDLKQHTNFIAASSDSLGNFYSFKNKLLFISNATATATNKLFSMTGTTLKQETDYKPGATDNVAYLGMNQNYFFYRAYEPGTTLLRLFAFDGAEHRMLVKLYPSGHDNFTMRGTSDNNAYFTLAGNEYAFDGSSFVNLGYANSGVPQNNFYSLGDVDVIPSQYGVSKLLLYKNSPASGASLAQISNTNPGGFDYGDYWCNCTCNYEPRMWKGPGNTLFTAMYDSGNMCTQQIYKVCVEGDPCTD